MWYYKSFEIRISENMNTCDRLSHVMYVGLLGTFRGCLGDPENKLLSKL